MSRFSATSSSDTLESPPAHTGRGSGCKRAQYLADGNNPVGPESSERWVARVAENACRFASCGGAASTALYPPKNSPKDWDKDIPQWIYEMWDYIVRNALGLKCKLPT